MRYLQELIMRGFMICRCCLIVTVMMAFDAGPGLTAGLAAETSRKALDRTDWSETLNGVRVRLIAPQGTTYREKSLLPLVVEVQNNTDKPVSFGVLWPTVRVLARDGDGKWLGVAAMGPELGEWVTRKDDLEPGKTTELKFAFQSLRFNRPLKPNEKIELHVSAPTQKQRPGQLPLEVNCPNMTISIESAFPKVLAEEDLAADWQMDLSCQVDVGLLGSQTVHVDDRGTATLVQNTQRNGQRMNGRMTVPLPAERRAKLAAALRKMQVWKLDETKTRLAGPDEGFVRLALVTPTGESLVGVFPSGAESDEPAIAELRLLIEALMHDIQTLADAKHQ